MPLLVPTVLPPEESVFASDHETSRHLHSFPPEARAQIGAQGTLKHVSELLPDTGVCVLVTVHDLVEDVDGIRRVSDKVGSQRTFVVAKSRPSYAESFCVQLDWARRIGHASDVLLSSHELTALLGSEAAHDTLRNGIVIVRDGEIVWSWMSDHRRPNSPHAVDNNFCEAFDRYNR